jgi:hypothetical protein
MSFINSEWLKERYANHTDDDLFDRHREIDVFGGSESEKMMIEMESKRRRNKNNPDDIAYVEPEEEEEEHV